MKNVMYASRQALAILTIFDNLVGQHGQRSVVSIHQMQVLEWNVMDQARFTSLGSLHL